MSHLEDKLAEYVFEELPAAEMEPARHHVSQCLECQGRVAAFRAVRHSLEQLPDVDLPRRMVFVPERTPKRGFPLAWAVPATAAAAALLAVTLVGPIDVDWTDSGVRIAWGSGAGETPRALPEEARTAVAAAIDYDALDYEAIALGLRGDQQEWLAAELQPLLEADTQLTERILAMNTARDAELQRLRAELNYLDRLQQDMRRDTYVLAQQARLGE